MSKRGLKDSSNAPVDNVVDFWRVTRAAYADLTGMGGKKASGRWHTKGASIIYAADSPSLAVLEYLVNLDLTPDLVPEDLVLLKIRASGIGSQKIVQISELPIGWREPDTDVASVRRFGDDWLVSGESLVLWVPSAVMPQQSNALINPFHEDVSKLEIVEVHANPVDDRFWELISVAE